MGIHILTKKNVTVSKLDSSKMHPVLFIILKLQLLFIIFFYSLASFSNTPMTSKSKAENVKNASHLNPQFSLSTKWSYSRNLYDHQDGTLREAATVSLAPGVMLSNKYSLSALFEHSSDLKNKENSDFSDLTIYLGRAFDQKKNSNTTNRQFTLLGALVTPVSKTSTRNSNLIGAGSVTGLMTISPMDTKADVGYSVILGLSAIKLVHQYETTIDGKLNSSYGSNQIVTLKFMAGRFTLGLYFTHRLRMSYKNTNKNSFVHAEEISYKATDNVSLAIGHTLEGVTQKTTGENNISGINDESSLVYMTLGISI